MANNLLEKYVLLRHRDIENIHDIDVSSPWRNDGLKKAMKE